jgi:hypothetical protein
MSEENSTSVGTWQREEVAEGKIVQQVPCTNGSYFPICDSQARTPQSQLKTAGKTNGRAALYSKRLRGRGCSFRVREGKIDLGCRGLLPHPLNPSASIP